MQLCIVLLKYICCWSGGKDSTASIILAHLHGIQLDTIIFSEVMFDKKNGISAENPDLIHFVKNVAKPVFESWGYEVVILHAEKDYLDVFNHVIQNPRKHMDHKGKKYGFMISGQCSLKRDCKMKPIQDYLKSLNEPYLQYVGIGIDEPTRLESLHKDGTRISLLELFGYTTKDAKKLCEEHDLLSPTYALSNRGGCWVCPNAKFKEHEAISKLYPEAWAKYVALEKEDVAHYKWNAYSSQTLAEIDELIKHPKMTQLTIFDYQDAL